MGIDTINPPAGFQLEDDIKPPEGFELESSWSDVPANAVKDATSLGKSLAGTAKTLVDPANLWESAMAGSMEPTKEKFEQDFGALKAMPKQLFDFDAIKQAITHPIQTFKEHPVNTALNVIGIADPALGMMGKGAGAAKLGAMSENAAARMAPLTDDISRVAQAAPAKINLPAEAADILKATPKVPSPQIPAEAATSGLGETLRSKIPKEALDPIEAVNNYIKNQYAETAKKPGMANIAADYLKEHSQNMSLKEMGAAPGQVRKIGVERAHELADYANENGLVGPKIGSQGREKLIKQRRDDAGGAVGAFRKIAADRGAVQNPENLIKQVQSKLDQKYLMPGMYSGQKGTYLKALQEIKKTKGTAEELSDKVTDMFKEAKNQNPLGKPTGPLADVAREVRAINHNAISKVLKPEEMTLYEKALEDYGALTQIQEFVKRRSSADAGGRLGPGSGISRAAVQKFLDSFGYRTEAKIAGKLSDFIRKNPDIMTRPKDIFRNYIDEAAEAIHEMGDPIQ